MAAGSTPQRSLQPGDIIRCTTRLGETYEGEVMGYDEQTQAVVISIFFFVVYHLQT